jgi:hypothetical protein
MRSSTSFKKGQIGNPKGKPKGTFSEHKKQFIKIQKLAANDAPKMYELLQNAIAAGESWAFQIYWKELYVLPKNYNEETIEVKLPEEIGNLGIDEYLKNFIEGLAKFEYYTKEEVNSIIKTLGNAKVAESIKNMLKASNDDNFLDFLSDDEVNQIKLFYDQAKERSKTMTYNEWWNERHRVWQEKENSKIA